MSAHHRPRPQHQDRNRRTGKYTKSPSCDGCGKPVGTDYFTDDEVCQGSDGPGFFLCDRKECAKSLEGLPVAERRALYRSVRARAQAGGKVAKIDPLSFAFEEVRFGGRPHMQVFARVGGARYEFTRLRPETHVEVYDFPEGWESVPRFLGYASDLIGEKLTALALLHAGKGGAS